MANVPAFPVGPETSISVKAAGVASKPRKAIDSYVKAMAGRPKIAKNIINS